MEVALEVGRWRLKMYLLDCLEGAIGRNMTVKGDFGKGSERKLL
jgi:hypothetical protein